MGMTLTQLLLSLVLPAVIAVLSMGLVIGLVARKAMRDGIPMQRPQETEEEWTARLRDQIEADRQQTRSPRKGS
jgi:hypothetical protein